MARSFRCTISTTIALLALPALAQQGPAAGYAHELEAAARRDRATLARCYEALTPAQRAEARAARAVVFRIAADGAVTDVAVEPTASAGLVALRDCAAPTARAWRLHAPPGHAAIAVRYTGAEVRSAVAQIGR